MNTAIITQARMSSTRFTGKVLKTIGDQTLLEIHHHRANWAQLPIIVATSTDTTDDAIAALCKKKKFEFFRGDLFNVLDRYYHCAKKYKLRTIIRITSDCPLIDGFLIKKGLELFRKKKSDYLSNTIKRTFPTGFDFEIISFRALSEAFVKATANFEKEHVTPYIWKTNPSDFKIDQLTQRNNLSSYRLTVDEPKDFELIKILINDFKVVNKTYDQISSILEENPAIAQINKNIKQKSLEEI